VPLAAHADDVADIVGGMTGTAQKIRKPRPLVVTHEDDDAVCWHRRCSTVGMRFVLVCLLAACGSGTNSDSCHSQSDCATGYGCSGPDDGPVCGIAPEHGCASDEDCAMGEVCHAIYDSCSVSHVGSKCDAPCTATSCDAGFRCNADGACEPTPCTTCASYQHCDASAADDSSGPVYAETDGCLDVTCTSDGDCDAGEACVNGFCQSSIGTCKMIVAVP
jgi:hypothetical protein